MSDLDLRTRNSVLDTAAWFLEFLPVPAQSPVRIHSLVYLAQAWFLASVRPTRTLFHDYMHVPEKGSEDTLLEIDSLSVLFVAGDGGKTAKQHIRKHAESGRLDSEGLCMCRTILNSNAELPEERLVEMISTSTPYLNALASRDRNPDGTPGSRRISEHDLCRHYGGLLVREIHRFTGSPATEQHEDTFLPDRKEDDDMIQEPQTPETDLHKE